MNKYLLWVGVAVIVIGAGWYVWSTDSRPDDGVVKVGGLFGQTGFVAFAGETSRNGFIMAIEDAGLNPDDFPIEDFQSDLKTTASAASKLVDVDGVDIIIGPEWAEFSEVVVPVARKGNALIISPWMDSELPWMDSDTYLTVTPSLRAHAQKILSYMVAQGQTQVALVYSNNAWALGYAELVKSEIAANYPSVIISIESRPEESTVDHRTELTKIKSKNPDVILAIIGAGQSAAPFFRQVKELGISAPVFTPFSTFSYLKTEQVEGTALDGVYYPEPAPYARTAEFNAKYAARFGSAPIAITGATTYDATTLVLNAIVAGATSADEVRDHIVSLNSHEGYSGNIVFNESGQAISGPINLKQFRNGTSVTIE